MGACKQNLYYNKSKFQLCKLDKKFTKTWNINISFFHKDYCICLYGKLWFIPSRFVIWKLWSILFCRQLEHLFEKIHIGFVFELSFHIFFKTRSFVGLYLIIKTISPLGLVCFNSNLELLTIYFFPLSCTNLYLTMYWRMQIKLFYFYFLTIDSQLKCS